MGKAMTKSNGYSSVGDFPWWILGRQLLPGTVATMVMEKEARPSPSNYTGVLKPPHQNFPDE
uniref:Uncharacterized protein n=1 Tax=Oryza glumipatula TaxID=40148 RepID=A0A0D9YR39_9ORYZ